VPADVIWTIWDHLHSPISGALIAPHAHYLLRAAGLGVTIWLWTVRSVLVATLPRRLPRATNRRTPPDHERFLSPHRLLPSSPSSRRTGGPRRLRWTSGSATDALPSFTDVPFRGPFVRSYAAHKRAVYTRHVRRAGKPHALDDIWHHRFALAFSLPFFFSDVPLRISQPQHGRDAAAP